MEASHVVFLDAWRYQQFGCKARAVQRLTLGCPTLVAEGGRASKFTVQAAETRQLESHPCWLGQHAAPRWCVTCVICMWLEAFGDVCTCYSKRLQGEVFSEQARRTCKTWQHIRALRNFAIEVIEAGTCKWKGTNVACKDPWLLDVLQLVFHNNLEPCEPTA